MRDKNRPSCTTVNALPCCCCLRLPYLASPPLTAVPRTHCAPGQSRAPLCVALLPHGGGVLRGFARLLHPPAGGLTILGQKKDAYDSDRGDFRMAPRTTHPPATRP